MCYKRRKIEDGVGALCKSGDTNFWTPNGQSSNLKVNGITLINEVYTYKLFIIIPWPANGHPLPRHIRTPNFFLPHVWTHSQYLHSAFLKEQNKIELYQ